jgi:Flp pilus assembly protein TadB
MGISSGNNRSAGEVPLQWGTMAKRYNEKKVRKELRRVEKAALKDLKKADKEYLRPYHDADNPLIKVPLKLLWAACVTTLFIIVWVVVGWFALGVLGFFWISTSSFRWSVLVPLVFSIFAWIFLL